jgi:CDGSH-type Zn-finger protein
VSEERVSITPYPDGPYLVRGPIRLFDEHGREIELRRRTIALCRCGHSRMRPFCDGTHKSIGFRAPGAGQTSDEPALQLAEGSGGSRDTRVPVADATAEPLAEREPGAG